MDFLTILGTTCLVFLIERVLHPVGDKGFLIVPYLDGEYNETVSYCVRYASLQHGPFETVWKEIFDGLA